MAELLSKTKRKYIEKWRADVAKHLREGNICRVCVTNVLNEQTDKLSFVRASDEHFRAMTEQTDVVKETDLTQEVTEFSQLPAVKFMYSHAEEITPDIETILATTMPSLSPSTNMVRSTKTKSSNLPQVNFRNYRTNTIIADENTTPPLPDLARNGPPSAVTRKSAKTAKEIYEKYDFMNSENVHGSNNDPLHINLTLTSMPWRSKTFLTLPTRFQTDNPRKSIRMLSRQKTNFGMPKNGVVRNGEYMRREDFYDSDERLRLFSSVYYDR